MSGEKEEIEQAVEEEITLVLDWTPNTNHVGFFVAQEKGWFKEANLKVNILSADDPRVLEFKTPARMVAADKADFAIAPSETALSFATSGNKNLKPKAVAALLQGSTSCIAVASSISSAKELEGKTYASYCGRFEDDIVRAMVDNDGGDGSKVNFVPLAQHGYADEGVQKVGFLSTLGTKDVDATWIFSHWEGIQAKLKGLELVELPLERYGIPYGYAPILISNPKFLGNDVGVVAGAQDPKENEKEAPPLKKLAVEQEAPGRDKAKRFLKAVERGYIFAVKNPESAAESLAKAANHSACSNVEFLKESMKALSSAILTIEGERWGVMSEKRWKEFVDFCFEKQVVKDRDGKVIERNQVQVANLFTNDLLPTYR